MGLLLRPTGLRPSTAKAAAGLTCLPRAEFARTTTIGRRCSLPRTPVAANHTVSSSPSGCDPPSPAAALDLHGNEMRRRQPLVSSSHGALAHLIASGVDARSRCAASESAGAAAASWFVSAPLGRALDVVFQVGTGQNMGAANLNVLGSSST
jgi:hypothetical protein